MGSKSSKREALNNAKELVINAKRAAAGESPRGVSVILYSAFELAINTYKYERNGQTTKKHIEKGRQAKRAYAEGIIDSREYEAFKRIEELAEWDRFDPYTARAHIKRPGKEEITRLIGLTESAIDKVERYIVRDE